MADVAGGAKLEIFENLANQGARHEQQEPGLRSQQRILPHCQASNTAPHCH
jgi:hypothetical protein